MGIHSEMVSRLINCQLAPLTYEDEKEANLDQLILSNIRFVVKLSGKYKAYAPQMDLISSGIFGLIQAANRWDKEKNLRFITYAVHYIRMEMRNCINSTYTIRYSYQKGLKYEYMDDMEKSIDFGEKYQLKTTHTPFDCYSHSEILNNLPSYIEKLTDIEKEVLHKRFIKRIPLRELSKQVNRTLVGTHLIEKRALNKLRKMIELD